MIADKFINILPINSESLKLLIGSTLTALTLFYGGFYNIAYSQDLVYSNPFLISTDPNMLSTMAASALDKNGKLHIVFVGWYYEQGATDDVASEIFYTNNLSGEFSEPEKLPKAELPFPGSAPYDFYYSKEPTIAVGSSGTVHVSYYRTEFQLGGASWICYTNNKNGDFSVPKILYYDPTDWYSRYYSYGRNIMLASGLDSDSIHIVFDGNIGTGHGGARYSVGLNGNFKVPRTITQRSGEPTIKFDNEGIPNIVYWINSDTTDILSNVNLVTSKILGGRFSSPTILFESNSWSTNENAFAFDQFDSAYIVFRYLPGGAGATQMHYIKGIAGQYTPAVQLPTNTGVSLMYAIDIGNNQTEYIAYKQAAYYQSLGFMYNDGSGFHDISPTDYDKYGFMSAGPQWFTLDKDNNMAYFVYTTGKIYMVTIDLNTISAVNTQKELSREFRLSQNYPNPFNPTTTIKYSLRNPSNVILKIYNLSGQEIETLINEFHTTGDHEITWQPQGLSSGIYFYKLQAGKFSDTKKLILQK
jgi:hypothetical protein